MRFVVILLFATCSMAQVKVSGVKITGVGINGIPADGPPNYASSRTDTATVQLPAVPPNVGSLLGANTIVTDPDFNSRIVRVTDGNTDSHPPFQNRTYITTASGSADDNIWNTDSTLFTVQDTGSALLPFTFNPNTMQAARMYVASNPSTDGLKLGVASSSWSYVNPQILYGFPAVSITKYDFTDRVNAPTPTTIYDFSSSANCLGAGYTQTSKMIGGVNFDDTVIGMGYSNSGGQGTGVDAVVYKVGSGCSHLNFSTGQVTGDWGSIGTIDIPDRWTLHNVKLSKDGNWLVLSTTTCILGAGLCHTGPYFWQVGTTHVTYAGMAASQFNSGHFTSGYTHWENNNNSPIGNQILRTFADPATVTGLTPNLPAGLNAPFDQHQSWNNVDALDSFPFFTSTWSTTTPFTGSWYNEIIAVKPDGSGKVWRFAHSFITTQNAAFDPDNAIGTVSQDGRFYLLSSDWMGTLGSTTGLTTCTIGSDCRGDVFIIELKSTPQVSEDLINWWINSSTTQHLEGTPPVNPIYSQLDPDGIKLWMLKANTGHPWDLEQYNGANFFHWITENGDAGQGDQWQNSSAYKRYLTPVRISPRFFIPNTTVVIDTPGPNTVERTINCGVDAQAPITIGDIRAITTGPLNNNFGGDLGTQSALTVDYYYSGTIASGIFNDRERYWLVKNKGLVQWEHDTWNGSAWVVVQTNPFNLIRSGSGTSVAPVFGCTSAPWWF